MRRDGEQLLKGKASGLRIPDLVPGDGVGQLRDHVQERRGAPLRPRDVPRPAPRRGDEAVQLGGGQASVVGEAEDAHEVGAEVGDEDEGARGVENDLVRVRGFLATGVGTGSGELKAKGLEESETCGVRGVEEVNHGRRAFGDENCVSLYSSTCSLRALSCSVFIFFFTR